ncbi:hypothetical protein AUQ43_16445 [Thalassospira sp. MCCC 1A01148]|nr:hypothetical protein AUQ43_16445 [Thalassospira sp. MCCC 1A01148]
MLFLLISFAETVFPFARSFRSLGKEILLFTSQCEVNLRRNLPPISSHMQNNGNAFFICIVAFDGFFGRNPSKRWNRSNVKTTKLTI